MRASGGPPPSHALPGPAPNPGAVPRALITRCRDVLASWFVRGSLVGSVIFCSAPQPSSQGVRASAVLLTLSVLFEKLVQRK